MEFLDSVVYHLVYVLLELLGFQFKQACVVVFADRLELIEDTVQLCEEFVNVITRLLLVFTDVKILVVPDDLQPLSEGIFLELFKFDLHLVY